MIGIELLAMLWWLTAVLEASTVACFPHYAHRSLAAVACGPTLSSLYRDPTRVPLHPPYR